MWNAMAYMAENSEKIWKIWKNIMTWYGKYRKKVGWIVKWYGNMEERQVE